MNQTNQYGFSEGFLNELVPAGISGTGGQVVDASQFGFGDAFLNELVPQNSGINFDSDFWFGNSKVGTGGAATPLLNFGSGLLNGYLGLQQLDLGKKQFKENKRQFDLNFGNQASLVNTNLADRQQARVGFNANTAQPVSTYMDKNAVRVG